MAKPRKRVPESVSEDGSALTVDKKRSHPWSEHERLVSQAKKSVVPHAPQSDGGVCGAGKKE